MGNIVNIVMILMAIFFLVVIGEIFKLKKEVRKLNSITKNLLDKEEKWYKYNISFSWREYFLLI